MKFTSWGDVYFFGLSQGYDNGFAAWNADQWEKRKAAKPRQPRPQTRIKKEQADD